MMEHILIMRFSAMGDVAMTVPVVHSLAIQYPELRITVLSQKFAKPFFEHMPQNVSFMEADIKSEYKGVKGLNALYRRLTAKHFTSVADLHDVLRSKYLRMRFVVDRYKVAHIDKHRAARKALTAKDGKKLVPMPTPFSNYADVFAKLGYPVNVDFKSIFPEGGGDLSLLPEKYAAGKGSEKWIGIAPFAAHEGKIYPPEKMESVVAMLSESHPDSRLFLFGGGRKEKEIFEKWCAKYHLCTFASAELKSLREELILISHLDVMVSMDSANMHLASLTGTPVVSVWGATHPYASFMGYNQSENNVVQTDLPCRPCSIYGNKPCLSGDYACMKGIAPEDIVRKIERVI